MATRLHRHQLRTLCSDIETYEKAESILRLVTARAGQGSGFVVSPVTVAEPAVCAYLACEQEAFPPMRFSSRSLIKSMTETRRQVKLGRSIAQICCGGSVCHTSRVLHILKTVRAALHTDDEGRATDVTYQTLVNTEAGHPRVDILKDRNGANVVLCAIVYWVAQVLEEPTVQERSFCQGHGISLKAFRSVMSTIGDQIKSPLLEIRRSTQAATSTSTNPDPTLASPQKSPTKFALKATIRMRDLLTPSKTPSNKRGVVFSNDSLNDNDDDSSFLPRNTNKETQGGFIVTHQAQCGYLSY
ncbi:hypothetical protein BU15DRAFT_68387 [Melanogaster broomeanus]|nr:hypothetical protein BU15DRAFT_68387 [Melanogaster broomeanus]